MSHKLVKYRRN